MLHARNINRTIIVYMRNYAFYVRNTNRAIIVYMNYRGVNSNCFSAKSKFEITSPIQNSTSVSRLFVRLNVLSGKYNYRL